MSRFARLARLALVLPLALTAVAHAAPKTVCTVTVNSPDEKELLRRKLPPDDYRFVELVEHGRPDWLASACQQSVRCDVLVVSGHFDDGTQFYSDRVDSHEHLPVDELQRASCSTACSGLFSQLKEVYLFGCNTLNAAPLHSATAETTRSLVRAGRTPEEAERITRRISEVYGESNRDRMRAIFHDVPVIYGFSSKAPLGPYAASTLERYFQQAPAGEIGSGVPSARLLGLFAPVSMTATSGLAASEPQAALRADVCRLAGDALRVADKAAFVHRVLERDAADVRAFLEPLERFVATLSPADRADAGVAAALASIRDDKAARERFLAFARDADTAAVRLRMLDLARALDWLDAKAYRAELVALIDDRLAARSTGSGDVDLVCMLNQDGTLDGERAHLRRARDRHAGHAAILACLGSDEAKAQVLQALSSGDATEVEVAQVYLRHRPVADTVALRTLARAVSHMAGGEAQVRALDALAQLSIGDRESLEELVGLFKRASSVNVQRAVAGILVRADFRAIAGPELVRGLKQYRLKSPEGHDMVDVLLRRLQAAEPKSADAKPADAKRAPGLT